MNLSISDDLKAATMGSCGCVPPESRMAAPTGARPTLCWLESPQMSKFESSVSWIESQNDKSMQQN